MASEPAFAVTPRIGSVTIATADSSYTTPTNTGTVLTGASTGTRIAEVVIKMAATSAAAIVRLFLHDGTNFWLFDEFAIAAVTGSATVTTVRTVARYDNLVLPNTSWSLRAATSVSQATTVTAFGADL